MPVSPSFHAVANGGASLRVAVVGDGPLVLFVHGFPELWSSWRHQLQPVADAGFCAAALDVRGYGGSSSPSEVKDYTIDLLVSDLAATVDELSDGSAVLVGHDWGGAIVQAACLLQPDMVRAVASLSTPTLPYSPIQPSQLARVLAGDGFFYQDYFNRPGDADRELSQDVALTLRRLYWNMSGAAPDPLLAVRRAGASAALLDVLPEPGHQMREWLTDTDLALLVAAFESTGFTGALNRYRAQDLDWDVLRSTADDKIGQPSLFIAGTKDPVRYLVPDTDLYADPVARFSDCRGVHFIEGVGHWTAEEAPEVVNAHLLEFLTQLN